MFFKLFLEGLPKYYDQLPRQLERFPVLDSAVEVLGGHAKHCSCPSCS